MFHGHHGASARTPCMYRWIASRVAGSSHDSGIRTVRLGTTSSLAAGKVSSASASIPISLPTGSTSGSTRTCRLRIPGVRSSSPAGFSASSR